jgi:hypothetical protein
VQKILHKLLYATCARPRDAQEHTRYRKNRQQQREFIDGLKSEPESALGVMECTIEILVGQLGAALTKKLALRASDSRRLAEFNQFRGRSFGLGCHSRVNY